MLITHNLKRTTKITDRKKTYTDAFEVPHYLLQNNFLRPLSRLGAQSPETLRFEEVRIIRIYWFYIYTHTETRL